MLSIAFVVLAIPHLDDLTLAQDTLTPNPPQSLPRSHPEAGSRSRWPRLRFAQTTGEKTMKLLLLRGWQGTGCGFDFGKRAHIWRMHATALAVNAGRDGKRTSPNVK